MNNGTVTALGSKRILVTGGAGFLGRSVTNKLRADGLDPLVTTFNQKQNNSELINLDLVDAAQTHDVVQNYRPQIVLHLAGVTGNSDPTGKIYDAVNYQGTVNLLRALEKHGVERVIMLGTAAEYGNQFTPFREDMKPKPVSHYAVSKARANEVALKMHAANGFPVVILRVFTAYGPGQPKKMFLSQLIASAVLNKHFKMSDGLQRRDFVHIDDVVVATKAAMTNGVALGHVINIANGQGVALRDLATTVWNICEANEIRLELGAIEKASDAGFDTEADISLARSILGWSPGVGILDELDGLSRLRKMIEKMKNDTQISAA